jgi:hypothetical protein
MPGHGVWPGCWPLVGYLLFLLVGVGIARYLEEFSRRTWQDPAACPLFLPVTPFSAPESAVGSQDSMTRAYKDSAGLTECM